MKKTLLTILFTLTMVCLFALGASAYETEYYTVDVSDGFTEDYESTEENTTWTSADGDAISIVCYDNNLGVDFADLSDLELDGLKANIEATYKNLGASEIDEITCSNGTLNGAKCMVYTVKCVIYSADISVKGYMLANEEVGCTIETIFVSDEGQKKIDSMLSTFALKGEENTVTDIQPDNSVITETDDIKFSSKDGIVSFTLSGDYVEAVAAGNIEKQWVSADQKFSVAYASMANEDFGSLKGLSKTELEEIGKSFAEGLGDDSTSSVAATSVTVNGYEGVKITADIELFGMVAELEVYGFATKETAMFVYFYCYDGVDRQAIDEVLDTLVIDGELYGDDTSFIVPIIVVIGAVAGIISALIKKKKSKNGKLPEGYITMNPVNNSFSQPQGGFTNTNEQNFNAQGREINQGSDNGNNF